MPITFLMLLAHDTLRNAAAIVFLLITASTPTPWTSHSEAGLSAAAALEVGAATSVQPSLYLRQQLFWSSRVRGGVRKPKLLVRMNPQSRFRNHGWTYIQPEVYPSKPKPCIHLREREQVGCGVRRGRREQIDIFIIICSGSLYV